jgi:hypothetical protein
MKEIALKLGIAVLAVFAPAQSVMLSCMALILADLFTGVIASRKRKEPLTSSGFKRTLVKLVVYETAIALGFIAQHYLMADAIPVINIIGSYVGLTELTSAYENINEISGSNLLKNILDKLNSNSKDRS